MVRCIPPEKLEIRKIVGGGKEKALIIVSDSFLPVNSLDLLWLYPKKCSYLRLTASGKFTT